MSGVTWDRIREVVGQIAQGRSEWAGMPMLVPGMSMQIHPSFPFAQQFGRTFAPEPSIRLCSSEDISDQVALRNQWASFRHRGVIRIWQDGRKFFFTHGAIQNSAPYLIETLKAANTAWSIETEIKAMETLRAHVSEHQFNLYLMTGMFLESSKKSGVFYVFRRLRPTIAMSARPYGIAQKEAGMHILCTLCSHPIGYYRGSYAGAMVPTDDLLSHLLLMRADEHLFWKNSNQHHASAPESGL